MSMQKRIWRQTETLLLVFYREINDLVYIDDRYFSILHYTPKKLNIEYNFCQCWKSYLNINECFNKDV